MSQNPWANKVTPILAVVFFSSGMTALTLQTVWNKILGQTVGTDYLSATIIVSIFMLGLGLGSQLGSSVARRTSRPLFWFAGFEILVAIYGALSLVLLRLVPEWSLALTGGTLGTQALATDFMLNLAVLIIPTMLMGATLPLVVQAAQKDLPPGATVGLFYAINIFGAIFGCLLSGYFLIGTFGLKAACLFATAVNLVLAMAAIFIGRKTGISGDGRKSAAAGHSGILASIAADKHTAAISFLSGFVALAYQMLYFRVAVYYFSATSYVFPTVLAAYLLLMFAGTFYAGRKLKDPKNLDGLVRFSLLGTIAATTVVFIIPYIIRPYKLLVDQSSGLGDVLVCLLVSMVMMLPVAFISMMFPAIIQKLSNRKDIETASLGARTGYAYLVQTMGNFVGALACGFLILPAIGVLNTAYVLCAIMVAVSALYAAQNIASGQRLKFMAPLLAALAVFGLAYPDGYTNRIKYSGIEPRLSEELEGTAFIYDRSDTGGARINIGAEPATSYMGIDKPMETWPIDPAMALLGRAPENILVIGIGPGHQAQVLHRLYPEARIEIVELLDVVIREMRKKGSPMLNQMLDHAKVTITDGRRYVTKLGDAQAGSYDFVQIGVFHSTSAGAGNLFTAEFITQVKAMMKPDGVLTFNAYLPAVQAAEPLFKTALLASRGPSAVSDILLSDAEFASAQDFRKRYLRTLSLMRRTAERNPALLLDPTPPEKGFFVWDREKLKSVLHRINPQTDDHLVTEYFLNNHVGYDSPDARLWPSYPADFFIRDIVK